MCGSLLYQDFDISLVRSRKITNNMSLVMWAGAQILTSKAVSCCCQLKTKTEKHEDVHWHQEV